MLIFLADVGWWGSEPFTTRVADPHHPHLDPACHCIADPGSSFHSKCGSGSSLSLYCGSGSSFSLSCVSDPAFYFNADPDPAFHSNADLGFSFLL